MADTLKARMEALKKDMLPHSAVVIDVCLTLLDEWSKSPEVVEKIAETVCPLVKPWIDDSSVPRHSCHKCQDMDFHGEVSTPLCKLVMREIAQAALSIITGDNTKRQG